MPKPILSDSLFNADDVATAVLQQANLQVANNALGVVDILDKFDNVTGINSDTTNDKAYYFNGFVFLDIALTGYGFSTNNSYNLMQINDSNYYPECIYRTNSVSYQGDSVNCVVLDTNGLIRVDSVLVPSGSDNPFRVNINCWYRTA